MTRLAAILTLFLLIPVLAHPDEEGPAAGLLSDVLKAYQDKDFPQAQKLLQALMEEHPRSPALHYNLGCVFLQQGMTGQAVLELEKGRLMAPRNPNIRAALALARKNVLGEARTSTSPLFGIFYFWADLVSRSECQMLVLSLSITAWGWAVWRKSRGLRVRLRGWLAILLFLYAALGYGLKASRESNLVVMLAPRVPVRATYLEGDAVVFELRAGQLAQVIDHQDFETDGSWLRVRLPDGQGGWVQADHVGPIDSF